MTSSILELFTMSTSKENVDWQSLVAQQYCPYIGKKCDKTRKSQPEVSIGTCTVNHGVRRVQGIVICPHRFLQRKQIFMDCLHLLTLHEPGNELHLVSEVAIPGGSVDYFLVSTRSRKVMDFVGIEVQALDTTGSVWPERQRFLRTVGLDTSDTSELSRVYGINWKMTAKTTLVQLHHKVETFEHVGKHFVLVLQDALLNYFAKEFVFGHIERAKLGDSMHFHAYSLETEDLSYHVHLASMLSTDANGIASALGLQNNPKVELEVIIAALQDKISDRSLLTV